MVKHECDQMRLPGKRDYGAILNRYEGKQLLQFIFQRWKDVLSQIQSDLQTLPSNVLSVVQDCDVPDCIEEEKNIPIDIFYIIPKGKNCSDDNWNFQLLQNKQKEAPLLAFIRGSILCKNVYGKTYYNSYILTISHSLWMYECCWNKNGNCSWT